MANSSLRLPDNRRVIDAISIGVLTKTYPVSRIKAVLQATDTESIRERALPAHVMVYYVLALTLWMHTNYEGVLGWLVEGLQWLLSPKEWKTPRKSAITQARQRLGWEPLQRLYEEVVQPVARPETLGAWYRGRRVVSLDGSTLEIADTEGNEKAFGRPGASRGTAAGAAPTARPRPPATAGALPGSPGHRASQGVYEDLTQVARPRPLRARHHGYRWSFPVTGGELDGPSS